MQRKNFIFLALPFLLLGVVGIWYWGYFFIGYPEFQYLSLTYKDDQQIIIEGRPTSRLDRWAAHPKSDLLIKFRNDSDQSCKVKIVSAKNNEAFDLEPTKEWDVILDRASKIPISFCDENLDLNYRDYL